MHKACGSYQVVLCERVSGAEHDAAAAQAQAVVFAADGGAELLLHLLLVMLGEDDDGQAALALVGEGELVEDGEALLAPAQDEGVAALDDLGLALLEFVELGADVVGDDADH